MLELNELVERNEINEFLLVLDLIFSHAHVTLYEGMSVRRSVSMSVGWSVRRSPVFFNRGIQAKM